MSKCRYNLSEDCNNTDCLNCVLDKIRVEIGRQYKWLINTRYTIRDVDIAFDSIFRFIDKYKAESEDKE